MPGTPGKTPIVAITHSEKRVGVIKQSDEQLRKIQMKYVLSSMSSKDISEKLYPIICTDASKMQSVMDQNDKPDNGERKSGLESLVLAWMPADFLEKPKTELTERVRTANELRPTL